jgi:hypothetical protein
MKTLLALLALAAPAAAQVAPFDMGPETPALAAALPERGPGTTRPAPFARRYVLPVERLRLEGETASRSWQVWLTEAEAKAGEAKLRLGYRSAILVAPEASRLRISVNGQTLADDPIKAPERPTELSAVLPAGLLKPGPNVFTIEAEQRHRTDCTEASTYDLWTEIDAGRSFLSFPEATRLTTLGDLRAVGVGPQAATRIAIVAPGAPAQALDLAQALALATAMPNTSFTVTDRPDEAFRAAELKVVLGDASAVGGQGAGPFVQSPFGSVLVLDGAPGETARISALAPQDASVLPTAAWRLPDAPLLTGRTRLTLAELGAPTREFSGRRSTVELQVALPADFYAGAYGEARLLLDAAWSAAVEPGSRIDVYVNDALASTLPIASAGGGLLRRTPLDVTMRHLRPGANLIRIVAVMKTAADAACLPGTAAATEPRFALFGTSEFVMPAFARIGRIPDLAATAGRGFPFAGAATPVDLVLAGPEALSAAATVLGKLAQSAGAPLPIRLASAAEASGQAIVIGAAPDIPPGIFARVGVDPAGLLAWQEQDPDEAPAPPEPTLDSWRGAVRHGAWLKPVEAVARSLNEAPSPAPAALGARFLLAQAPVPGGSLTLVTAPNARLLAEGAAQATRQTRWAEIGGRASALDSPTGAMTVTPATETEFVATQPPSFANWRLIGANWMSSNALAFAAVFAFACTLFGLVTTGLLAKLGRHG